ncbi:MAG: DUF302 domain-containing protein [Rhodobiaceae bacterium]|nr:DUF302 domain-containing protein [Rhodobiaceae bacterium]MCC0016281.1 DUF302 domain-containing protein [Rhodobiaceae bacterium]MCC0041628.1 DUF302 domain-containing protein [Rhodobiaceae bacterium]MCC0052623.1 DUF302 domain-containing protein [Rhodobiaceae bacterium]
MGRMTATVAGVALAATGLLAAPVSAADDLVTVTTKDAPFATVAQDLNDAIVNRGFNIDYHGFIGDMLKRTAGDVGATKELYSDAEFFTFCSAVVSRRVMEAEIGNIAYCPYVLFVYEDAAMAGTVTVGFRKLPAGGGRDEVNTLLEEIAKQAAGGM